MTRHIPHNLTDSLNYKFSFPFSMKGVRESGLMRMMGNFRSSSVGDQNVTFRFDLTCNDWAEKVMLELSFGSCVCAAISMSHDEKHSRSLTYSG